MILFVTCFVRLLFACWRAVGRLKPAVRSGDSSMVTSKVVLWPFQTINTVTRKVNHTQGRQRATTNASWLYAHDDRGGQRLLSFLMTLLLCMEKEFPGKQSTGVLQRLALTSSIQTCVCVPLTLSLKFDSNQWARKQIKNHGGLNFKY
ncbi:hypothetical protein TNCV_2357111 [Trichonephila clavipes]|nr:hypothetical protein TNCV_2357111 [Trichonephila clavipes]